ncbi:lipoate--protein ligase [Lactobacillus sp. DCY120]|uniref:lipoate--protein ligase n=1 Tax=Bombilactobacillus apium TaxID=2675299 RepID=A0A850R0B1_9LACO|nr:lipoate--protein ligase [Bombilactobacillus apium]NVY96489.1 lipoate--protein ligase [Bombilactobacillus apium]
MYYFIMPELDIRTNLATEQYLMNNKDFDAPLVLFYIQKPCIIVGRNQNTLEELNTAYVREQQITVTRRLSGGGAVYDDLGNVSFSFVVNAEDESFGDFRKMVAPIVQALHQMGATGAEVSGRNDILIDGKKFSGNAMYTKNGKTFSHGTLSYDVDLDVLTQALRVNPDKIQSKGIKSIRSRVTNLRPYLKPEYQHLTTAQFRDQLLLSLFAVPNLVAIQSQAYQLTAADRQAIADLKERYYANWDWVYGQSPDFTVQKRKHFPAGTIDARLQIKGGRIVAIKFYGDFFGQKDVAELEEQLVGLAYTASVLEERCSELDLPAYFNRIDPQAICTLIQP